jgi:hypothetical protein
MDDRFLTPSRLDMLRQVTQGNGSASTIARTTSISLPYVLTQLQLLEAKNFIKKTRTKPQKGPGKPRTTYELASPFAHLLLAREGFCEKVTFSQAPPSVLLYLQLASFVQQQLSSFSKYYWKHSKKFSKLVGVGLLDIKPQKVELVAFCEPEDLDHLRKQISNEKINDFNDKEITFVTWVHTFEELRKGKETRDNYYLQLLDRMSILMDQKEVLHKLKEKPS